MSFVFLSPSQPWPVVCLLKYSFLFTGLTPFDFDTSKVLYTCQIFLWKKKI